MEDVLELSGLRLEATVESSSGSESESELESLENDPEDDVSSLSECAEEEPELDSEAVGDS